MTIGVRKRIFFIPGRPCRQVGVFSGYGACSSPTLPLVNSYGGSTISTTQDIFRFYEVEVALAHWSKKSVMKWGTVHLSFLASLSGRWHVAVVTWVGKIMQAPLKKTAHHDSQ